MSFDVSESKIALLLDACSVSSEVVINSEGAVVMVDSEAFGVRGDSGSRGSEGSGVRGDLSLGDAEG